MLEQATALEADAAAALHMRKVEVEEAERQAKVDDDRRRADLVRQI